MVESPEPSRPDADELFARARSGDEEAWDQLFRACHPKLLRAIRRRLGTPMRSLYDSSDFASDVWRSLVAKADRFDFPTLDALIGFMAKAAEQKIIDEHRRLHTLKADIDRLRPMDFALGDGEAGSRALASHDPTPSAVAVANEGYERILADRTGEEREVIELRRLNYPNGEIAPKVGWDLRKLQRFLKSLGESFQHAAGGRP